MSKLLALLITLYQHTLSPDYGPLKRFFPYGYCRYSPSCSEYTKQALLIHGTLKGSFLGLARITRCHPWAAFGLDPVPSKTKAD